MRRPQRLALGSILALALFGSTVAPSLAQAPATGTEALRTERLTRLGRLWGQVRYLHPYLAYRDIDWDAALLQAIPKVRSAPNAEAYAAAVQEMLEALGDPATRVMPIPASPAPTAPETTAEPAPSTSLIRQAEEGIVLVDLRPYTGPTGIAELYNQTRSLGQELQEARAIVVDARGLPERDTVIPLELAFGTLTVRLVSREIQAPATRYLFHSGYHPQRGRTSGSYFTGFMSPMASTFSPSAPLPRRRVVFVTNSRSFLPSVAFALQAAGDGVIVSEDEINDSVTTPTRTVDLGEGYQALMRVAELLPIPGWPGARADVVTGKAIPGKPGDPALDAALAEARKELGEPAPPALDGQPLPPAVWRPDKRYDETDPSPEHRLLAVFRIWHIIHYFYPYKHLIGDWDAVLPEFVARMETIVGPREYAAAVAEMLTYVPDSHTSVYGGELRQVQGEASVPIELRWIEGSFAVTAFADDPELKAAGIEIGDVLTAVDGQPVEEKVASLRCLLASSTETSLRNRIAYFLARGPEGSFATLTLRGRDGRTRDVKLLRTQGADRFQPKPVGETVRILPGNWGYADLTRLKIAEVDSLFEQVEDTRGLILDMRGYPQGTAWSIAPRINVLGARYGAVFRRKQVSGMQDPEEQEAELTFSQPLPVSDAPKYTRPIVMLINNRAISQAEHSGLFFEAAAGVTFIGTPTAGANGDVTNFHVPGGLSITFGGHDVRHADGRQLQRVGLQPHIEVAPTLEGLRTGRDEVLERALRYLEEKAPAGR